MGESHLFLECEIAGQDNIGEIGRFYPRSLEADLIWLDVFWGLPVSISQKMLYRSFDHRQARVVATAIL
jgi:hypothetical protein